MAFRELLVRETIGLQGALPAASDFWEVVRRMVCEVKTFCTIDAVHVGMRHEL